MPTARTHEVRSSMSMAQQQRAKKFFVFQSAFISVIRVIRVQMYFGNLPKTKLPHLVGMAAIYCLCSY